MSRKTATCPRRDCHAPCNRRHKDDVGGVSVKCGARSSNQGHKPDSSWVNRSFQLRTKLATVCASSPSPVSASNAAVTAPTVPPRSTASIRSSCTSRSSTWYGSRKAGMTECTYVHSGQRNRKMKMDTRLESVRTPRVK